MSDPKRRPNILFWAGILGGLGVGLGAFGAHGFKPILVKLGTVATWETAVLYHFVHALALLGLAGLPRPPRWVVPCFLSGTLLFSGSLYVLSLSGMRWLGAITPLGGVLFLIGWASGAWWGWKEGEGNREWD